MALKNRTGAGILKRDNRKRKWSFLKCVTPGRGDDWVYSARHRVNLYSINTPSQSRLIHKITDIIYQFKGIGQWQVSAQFAPSDDILEILWLISWILSGRTFASWIWFKKMTHKNRNVIWKVSKFSFLSISKEFWISNWDNFFNSTPRNLNFKRKSKNFSSIFSSIIKINPSYWIGNGCLVWQHSKYLIIIISL